MNQLPSFRFHPDPLGTGFVLESDTECVCCGLVRGYVYVGPVYSVEEYVDCICPWCIADGTAHERLDATFHDDPNMRGAWDTVPQNSVEEIAFRTPGFASWQHVRWWSHCGDAACFIGRAGQKELQAAGPEAIAAVRESTGLIDDKKWNEFFALLDKDGSPTAYLFRCLRCGKIGGYQDCD